MNYNNQFNVSGISFDAPLASVYIEYVDPISTLEDDKDKLLNTLEADKEVFIEWLATINLKHISTLKMGLKLLRKEEMNRLVCGTTSCEM